MKAFLSLPAELQAKVALAVLLDGGDAQAILALRADDRDRLIAAATEIFAVSPDVRLPLLGTYLREAVYGISPTSIVEGSASNGGVDSIGEEV